MNWFQLNLRKLMWFGLALMLPLLSLNMQRKPFESAWYDQPFHLLVGGVQNVFFMFSDGVRGTTAEYLNLLDIKAENARLKSANAELLARLTQYDELSKENSRLAGLLDFREKTKMELMAAEVVSRDILADHSTVRINKGTHHGLRGGQAVLTTDGVAGYIYRPESFSSLVLLVTDRYAVVDGIVSRSRARGIVEGKSRNMSALRYVERFEDVKVGDTVVTSGLDNIFPKGLPIAVVESVDMPSSSVSLKVDLRPVVDPDKIEEVFIVLNAANEDLTDRYQVAANTTAPAAASLSPPSALEAAPAPTSATPVPTAVVPTPTPPKKPVPSTATTGTAAQ